MQTNTALILINGEAVSLLVYQKTRLGQKLIRSKSQLTYLAQDMERHENFLQTEPIARTAAAVCDFYDEAKVLEVKKWQLVLILPVRPQNPEDLGLILRELTGLKLRVAV